MSARPGGGTFRPKGGALHLNRGVAWRPRMIEMPS